MLNLIRRLNNPVPKERLVAFNYRVNYILVMVNTKILYMKDNLYEK